MTIKLTKKDKLLLNNLMKNARLSISQIAKSIGVSKEVANYRLKRLENQKLIKGYYPIIDISGLGYQSYRIQIKYNTNNIEIKKQILDYLRSQEIVSWIYELAGKWDLVVLFWVKNVTEYNGFYDELMTNYGQYFQDKLLTIVTKIHYFKRNMVTEIKDRSAIISGLNSRAISIEQIDFDILEELLKNARMPLQQIATKHKVTINAIKYRMKKLEDGKILLGYRPDIDVSKIDLDYFKIQLILNNSQEKNKLLGILYDNNHTIYITESIGPFDLEFEADYHQISELIEFIDKIRETINIKNYDIIFENKSILINEIPEKLTP